VRWEPIDVDAITVAGVKYHVPQPSDLD